MLETGTQEHSYKVARLKRSMDSISPSYRSAHRALSQVNQIKRLLLSDVSPEVKLFLVLGVLFPAESIAALKTC
ncbi:hypothetical protein [Pelobacter propionicus]|uniref:hypothetical protein n=1 Tax=Pelobacter propionicus TaxID=29543 RepID=UPI0005A0635F|nr:hypothetical protein [Pelobacter propionicus]